VASGLRGGPPSRSPSGKRLSGLQSAAAEHGQNIGLGSTSTCFLSMEISEALAECVCPTTHGVDS
jgi:hypothetical protein